METTPQRLSRPLLSRTEAVAIALLLGLPLVAGWADADLKTTDGSTMSAEAQTAEFSETDDNNTLFWTLDELG